MIQWLLRLIGIAPQVDSGRRHSLMERLRDPDSEESTVMARAQRSLERHRRREEAIAAHQASVAVEKATVKAQRAEHQSEIEESTISLNRVRRSTEQIRKKRLAEVRRRNEINPNPFMAAELARKEAERRRLEG